MGCTWFTPKCSKPTELRPKSIISTLNKAFNMAKLKMYNILYNTSTLWNLKKLKKTRPKKEIQLYI